MNQRRARAVRKALGMESNPKADYRVIKEVKKMVGFKNKDGEVEYVQAHRKSVANAAKYSYRRIKKDKRTCDELVRSVREKKQAELVTE